MQGPEIIEAISPAKWFEFGIAGAVILLFAMFLIYLYRSNVNERKEWRTEHKAERDEWKGEIKTLHVETCEKSDKLSTVCSELSRAIQELVIRSKKD